MERLPAKANTLLSGEYIDASSKLSDINFKFKVETETRNSQWYGANGWSDTCESLGARLNTAFFGEGKLPRRGGISGPVFTSDAVFASEPIVGTLDSQIIARNDGILHGFTFVTIVERNREVRLPAIRCDSLVDEQTYYFPFNMIDSVEYARDPVVINTIVNTFERELESVHELRQQMVASDVSNKAQRSVFSLEQRRINNYFRDIIDKHETFTFLPEFYYFFEEGTSANLMIDNSEALGINKLIGVTELKGTFIGFSMPLIIQPELIQSETFSDDVIDPYEPCLMFYNDDTKNVYAVPYASLLKLS